MSLLRNGPLGLFGGASGLMARISPQARLVTGCIAGMCCIVVPGGNASGFAAISVIVMLFLTAARLKSERIRFLAAIAAVMHAPLLVAALISRLPWPAGSALAGEWLSVAVRGVALIVITGGTVSSMTLAEFAGSLRALRLPSALIMLSTHILQQTSVMMGESIRTRQALQMRGTLAGRKTALSFIRHLPVVWLPRLLSRAERVAGAMEVRGFTGYSPYPPASDWKRRDIAAVSIVTIALAGTIAARWFHLP